jgi:tetratricopeptide (TPR) repeat protein/energy-coupling factor transporter ATP-binding protein EcfA2
MAAQVDDGRPFLGRMEAVEALYRRFEDARAGTGGVTLLVGATGTGKSTLIRQLEKTFRSRGAQVLVGRAPALDVPPPFTLIRSAIESVHHLAEADPGAPLGGGTGSESVLIGFAPRLHADDTGPPVRIEERLLTELEEAEGRTELSREPLWSGIVEQFLQVARHGPTVLILEDLHRSDDLSLEALEYLAGRLEDRPFWILATSRPFEALAESRRMRLEAFEGAVRARRTMLRPFNAVEVADYLRWREPERSFTSEEVQRRFSETGGNPLLLEQFDRRFPEPAATDSEATTAGAAADTAELGEEDQRVLAVAAVLGSEFPFTILLRASGEEEELLAESVDRLVGRGLLFERAGEVLAFSDDRIRARTYAQLTESRRRLLHRRAGEALEVVGSADVGMIYALAQHFYLGKVDEKSVAYSRAAAEIAERVYAHETVQLHLERALEGFRRLHPEDADGETELMLELALEIDHQGRFREAEKLLRDHLARRGSERISPPIRAMAELYIAQSQADQGEWGLVAETTDRVLGSSDLASRPHVALALHRLRGESLYYMGKYPESLAEHAEEFRIAQAAGNERAMALSRSRRANVLAMTHEVESAMSEAREAARILEQLGDAREAAHAHLFLGVMYAGQPPSPEKYDLAEAQFSESIRLAERAHDQRRVGWALFNSADVLREAGHLDMATEKVRRAREILEELGDRFGVVQSRIIQGKIELDQERYDAAEADLLEAYRLVRELRAPADEVDVLLRLAQLSFARGDRASARRRVDELERLNVRTLRPDVAGDFDRLVEALASSQKEDPGAAPPG